MIFPLFAYTAPSMSALENVNAYFSNTIIRLTFAVHLLKWWVANCFSLLAVFKNLITARYCSY
jgi:hypothetical protein